MRGVGASAKTLLNISDQFICIEDLAAIPVGVNNCGPLDRDNYSGPIDPLRQKAPEHRRGNRNIAKIEVNGNAAVQPLLRQAFLDRGSKKNSLAYTPPQRDGIKEPLTVPLAPRSVHHPHHVAVKRFTQGPLLFCQEGMLEFDDKPMPGLNVGNVFLAVRGIVDHLSAIFWESVLPALMPFGFRFPPSITGTFASMRPMPDPHRPALGNHWLSAEETGPHQVLISSCALALDQSKLHALPSTS